MNIDISLSILSLIISGCAAVYAYWNAREAKRANDISRLNALLVLQKHYLALMANEANFAKEFRMPSASEAASNAYAALDTKLREVNREIGSYHARITKPD